MGNDLNSWWTDRYAGAQQAADPHVERKALEAALESAQGCYDARMNPEIVRVRRCKLGPVLKAARKHLETLPKPEPKFRVVGQRRNGGRDTHVYEFAIRHAADAHAADAHAAEWMKSGRYNSVAVEQVSP